MKERTTEQIDCHHNSRKKLKKRKRKKSFVRTKLKKQNVFCELQENKHFLEKFLNFPL